MIHFSLPTWAAVPLGFAAALGLSIFAGNVVALVANLVWFGGRKGPP